MIADTFLPEVNHSLLRNVKMGFSLRSKLKSRLDNVQIFAPFKEFLNNKIGRACALYSVKVSANCPYLYGFSVSILSLAAQYFQSDFVFEVLT